MDGMRRVIRATALFIVLSCIASQVRGGIVDIATVNLDEGNVVALLEATSQRYVDAMHRLIETRYREDYRAIRWEDLETSMTNAPVARLEYHFTQAGGPRVRVYHAMGGEPIGLMGKAIFEGPTRPQTPTTPSYSPSDRGSFDEAMSAAEDSDVAMNRVAKDAEDDVFYSGFDETDVRSRVLPAGDSVLEPFPSDAQSRDLDPELKALRQIEDDVRNKRIPAGGRIQGSVGGSVCASCRYAMQSLSDTYRIDIHVTQMFGSVPAREQRELIASGRARLRGRLLVDAVADRPLLAFDALAGARSAQVQQKLSPRAMNRTFKGMLWRQRSFKFPGPSVSPLSESPENRWRDTNPDSDASPPPRC